jgi:signal transduction histidine kinase
METMASDELADLAALADIGEIAGPLAHEFNNVLNTLLLHVAILEPAISDSLRCDLAEIRKQAGAVTELVRQFQHYRKRQLPAPGLLDLNEVVRQTVAKFSAQDARFATTVAVELDPELPGIAAKASDVNRLCKFLLGNAHAAALTSRGSLGVRTYRGPQDRVTLHVEDSGPSLDPESLSSAFELALLPRPGTSRLELAACKSIVRRSEGTIHAANRPEGGMTVIVEWQGDNGSLSKSG